MVRSTAGASLICHFSAFHIAPSVQNVEEDAELAIHGFGEEPSCGLVLVVENDGAVLQEAAASWSTARTALSRAHASAWRALDTLPRHFVGNSTTLCVERIELYQEKTPILGVALF